MNKYINEQREKKEKNGEIPKGKVQKGPFETYKAPPSYQIISYYIIT